MSLYFIIQCIMSLAWQIMLKMVLISQTLTNLILSANENAWFQLFDQWKSWKIVLLYLFEDQKLIREHHYLQATRYWTNMNIFKSIFTKKSSHKITKTPNHWTLYGACCVHTICLLTREVKVIYNIQDSTLFQLKCFSLFASLKLRWASAGAS